MKLSLFILLCLVLILLAACASPTATLAPTIAPLANLKLCMASVSAYQIPVQYAFEKGLFKKYGLDVELVPFENGQLATTALIAGQVDACQVAGSNIVNAAVAGEDLELIAGLYNRHVYSLVVNPKIQNANDLKGKIAAAAQSGSATDTALRVALKYFGLEPDRDVTIVSVGSTNEIVNALQTGRADGGVLNSAQVLKARKEGYRELLDLSTLDIPYQHLGIAVNRKLVETRRADALNLLRAISDAMFTMRRDPEGTKQVLARYNKLDPQKDAELLDGIYQIVVQRQLADLPYPKVEPVQALLDFASSTNPAAKNFDAKKIIDDSLVRELDQSGLFKTLEQ